MHNKKSKFQINTITMHELRLTKKKIMSSNSTSWDNLSIKTIKYIQKRIEPAILNLVNTSIQQKIYPDNLKCSKAIPLLKQDKEPTSPLIYRLINILPSTIYRENT